MRSAGARLADTQPLMRDLTLFTLTVMPTSMHFDASKLSRNRRRMIAALIAAPLLIALPVVRGNILNPEFLLHQMDLVLIFFVVPLFAALWLAWKGAKLRR